ncbi:MAG: hypothetical protein H6Q59_2183 [Firmicutes bacterium]|nr:hypothetical protein [Bacillota bacterium]
MIISHNKLISEYNVIYPLQVIQSPTGIIDGSEHGVGYISLRIRNRIPLTSKEREMLLS